MGRKKAETYATDAELGWFSLKNYEALRGQGNTYRQWVSIIRDRVGLRRLIDVGLQEKATPLFERIKVAPLASLGFGQNYHGPAHPLNTPTVKPLSANRVKWLNEAMTRSNANDRSIVDEQLAIDGEKIFDDYTHLMVNIRASDAQVIDDFTSWLSAWRKQTKVVAGGNYSTKIGNWASSRVVEYMDLELFSRLTGREIDIDRKFAMLLPLHSKEERLGQQRRLHDLRAQIFTDEMALIIQHLDQGVAGQVQE